MNRSCGCPRVAGAALYLRSTCKRIFYVGCVVLCYWWKSFVVNLSERRYSRQISVELSFASDWLVCLVLQESECFVSF